MTEVEDHSVSIYRELMVRVKLSLIPVIDILSVMVLVKMSVAVYSRLH